MFDRTLHNWSLIIGSLSFIGSIILAVFLKHPHFYTIFAGGSWLIFDYLNWRWNKKSLLAYFLSRKRHKLFFGFFILATFFCFLVDYLYGVKLARMWDWVDYHWYHYLEMYLFMNAFYILSMHELFSLIYSRLALVLSDRNLFHWQVNSRTQRKIYQLLVLCGVLFLLSPLYSFFLKTEYLLEYVMILPFLGMLFIADGFSGLLGGKLILADIIKVNFLKILSFILTVIVAASATEALNLFAHEWVYLKMPFQSVQILGVPVAVFIGWLPLVVGVIAVINFIKNFERVRFKKNIF